MLITKVKVGKITNLSDARYCAGMGVDFLSFPISGVDPKTYREITGWVAGPQFGVEADGADLAALEEYKSDFVQVTADQLDHVTGEHQFIVSLDASHWASKKQKLAKAKDNISFVELTVQSLDANTIQLLAAIAADYKILVVYSSQLDLEKLLQLPIAGISLEGNSETKPGLKEYPFSEILERLETAD